MINVLKHFMNVWKRLSRFYEIPFSYSVLILTHTLTHAQYETSKCRQKRRQQNEIFSRN